ncbi:uncharacterized protein LOC111271710 isoform X3 [Varroa jacobsoni]|uniref:3'-5' exonuclease domain-containing protein n=1 Tax=Varroa destructor TaxID=109461 RepID=A0A7M7JK13_VARDE|nr:uncharacterized protein LOC111245102 isoform X2 [Varroa destructor]XP_022708438.1 uncharacterized protein LOC111271710 isoform X3 [Varroa jacobsoni]
MDNFRRKPSIVDEIKKQRILHVNDRKTLDHAVKILNRYFVVGLDAKVQRGPSRKYVTYIVLATSNELILVDVHSLQRMPTSKMFDLLALAKLLSDPNITKVGFGMSAKQQLIKVALGGYFLQGVVDMQEAFRAIEITNSHLTAPSGAACEGLRTLEKICYNLLDKQIPAELCDNPEGAYLSEMGRIGVVTEAFIVFHAYVELERRVRPSHLQSLIAELLTEPAYDDYLKLCIPWNSVYLVETVDGYLDAVEYLKTCSVIGFDSEWKPTRCPGAPGRMALLQVASDDKVFLFDVLELHRVLTYGDWALLKSIFTDSDIVKLGFDTRTDRGSVEVAPRTNLTSRADVS